VSSSAEGLGRTLVIVGISREAAAVEIRERAWLDADTAARLLRTLRTSGLAEEALALSTCNRTEVYAVIPALEADHAPDAIRRQLANHTRISEPELRRLGYVHIEHEVAEHLFGVLAGLGSSILGEPEIVGQARAAVALARHEGMFGQLLEGLFSHGFAAGRRVRANTAIARGALSLSSVAVDLAESSLPDIASCSILVIGAGKVARAVTRRLVAAGAREIVVANRSEPAARRLAGEFGNAALALGDVAQELTRADLVVCATGAPTHILTRPMLAAAAGKRRERSLVVLDLAVPRDVEPAARTLPSVVLQDIDDLHAIAVSHLNQRRRELPRANAIVRAEAKRFGQWRDLLHAEPVLNEIRRVAEQTRRGELERATERYGPLSEAELERLDAVTRSLMNKLLHTPVLRIRNAGATDSGFVQLEALRELFGLSPEGGHTGEPPARDGVATMAPAA
jgi:glutamyl-tRNA reductase